MHEVAIAQAVRVRAGEMLAVSQESLQFCFDWLLRIHRLTEHASTSRLFQEMGC